nr:MAG TPA: hypothetical protein [Caudoviricetes sp.]
MCEKKDGHTFPVAKLREFISEELKNHWKWQPPISYNLGIKKALQICCEHYPLLFG